VVADGLAGAILRYDRQDRQKAKKASLRHNRAPNVMAGNHG
jgi:hypothetical protein